MRRAAISIPSNIAEGFNRYHISEYRQFLYIALGSCGELETQLEIAKGLEYLKEEISTNLLDEIVFECRMTRSLIKKMV
jgi:four helix bundle protein